MKESEKEKEKEEEEEKWEEGVERGNRRDGLRIRIRGGGIKWRRRMRSRESVKEEKEEAVLSVKKK